MVQVMTSLPTEDATFSALLAAHRARMLAFLDRLCGPDAEDVLQETLARVWRYREGFDPAGNPAGWLLQAAFRAFLDHRRRRQREPRVDDDAVRAAAAQRACPVETRDEIERGLHRLQPLERALLLGFHAEGASLRELAAAHRLPLNTVKSHLHRARQKLTEVTHDTP